MTELGKLEQLHKAAAHKRTEQPGLNVKTQSTAAKGLNVKKRLYQHGSSPESAIPQDTQKKRGGWANLFSRKSKVDQMLDEDATMASGVSLMQKKASLILSKNRK